jgi:hypothetical protein
LPTNEAETAGFRRRDGLAAASCAHGRGREQGDRRVKEKNHIVTIKQSFGYNPRWVYSLIPGD